MSIIEVSSLRAGHTEVEVLSSGSTYEGWRSGPNSVGGVGVEHYIYNASDKTIKYLTFTYEAYNRVGDVVACQTSGKTESVAELTGPIAPQEECQIRWKALWYNPTVSQVVIKQMLVQYMDDSKEIIYGDQVLNIKDENSEYYKRKKAAEEAKKAAEEERKAAEEARKQKQKEEAMQAINALKDSVVGGLKGFMKKK